jgi:predicted nucleotidyltransferase
MNKKIVIKEYQGSDPKVRNLKQMKSSILNNVPKAISRTYKSPSFWGFWEDVTDAEKNASSINKSKIGSIRSGIEQTNNRLAQKWINYTQYNYS